MDDQNRHQRDRRRFLKELGTGTAAMTAAWPFTVLRGESRERPNVVLIMTDDQGYGDLGVTGNPVIRTPNIDAMAERSARMEQFYVHPVCSPTRACLMTGRYNHRTRVIDTWVGRSMMDPDEVTIAELLKDSGYATGIFGKWHLGDNYPMRAMDQGFEESLVHRGGGIGQPSDPPGGEGKYTDPILFHNGEEVQAEGFCTDVYFDAALQWLGDQVERERPFFAYVAPNAPHDPFHDVPQDLYEEYQAMDLGNDYFPQERGHPLPESADLDRRARIFAMITNIDDNVGKLFGGLDALGITRNTIVIFMVDNGPNGQRYVAGMRGSKTSVYEGGVRSPFFVQWPERLTAGHSSDRIAAHIDVLPTILDACEVPVPTDLRLDGRSLLPLLEGRESSWPDRTIHLQAHRGDRPFKFHNFAARSQKWKFLHASGFGRDRFDGAPALELYDMEFDPFEEHNIAHLRPDVLRNMLHDYEEWFDDVGSTRPDNYAPPKIVIGTRHENPTVLTRQNWRSTEGSWARYTNGRWELQVANLATWNIRLRFPVTDEDAEVILHLGDNEMTGELPAGASGCIFHEVVLPMGPLDLSADIRFDDVVQGPWQIDLIPAVMADQHETLPGTGSSGRLREERPLLILLLGIALFHVVTMPRFTYPGDNHAPRAAAVSLLTTGSIGIDPSARPELESFLTQRGQYFFEREGSGKLYSKYGIGNTLLSLPPLIMERLTGGKLAYQSESGSLLIWLNLWSIVLTLVATIFLYRIVSLYTARPLIRVGFILVLYYTTFVWYYLRSPGIETFQIVSFLGFTAHFLSYLRGGEKDEEGNGDGEDRARQLLMANVWFGALVLMKLFFVVLIPLVWFFALTAGPKDAPLRERLRSNRAGPGLRQLIRPLVVPMVVIVTILLVVNLIKFGSPFDSGYSQWLGADGKPHDRFAFAYIWPALSSFLWRPGNANIFIHAPSLLVAIFGIPAFFRSHRAETLFLLTVAGVIFLGVIPFSSWAGEWCYGPRYLLPIALIGTLPRIRVGEWLIKAPRRVAAPIVLVVGAILLWSFGMQVRINSLHYFTFHRTQAFFTTFQAPGIAEYYGGLFHRGVLHRDLIRYREGRGEFPPATILREMVPPEARGEVDRELGDYLGRAAEPNWLFF